MQRCNEFTTTEHCKKTNELTINMNMKSTLYTRRHNNTNMLTTKWFQSRNIKHLSDLLVQGTSNH